MGLRDDAQLDFRQYGILDWLAERAEQLGFSYPTGKPLHYSPGGPPVPVLAHPSGMQVPVQGSSYCV